MTLGEGPRSLVECKEALEILRGLKDIFFGTPTNEETIARAEEALGLRIPPSMRHFVASVGKCEVGPHEILGITHDSFATDAAVNIVGATLLERRQGLPHSCIVFENLGNGTLHVLDADHGYMVRAWPAGPYELSEQIRASFGSYLLRVALDQREDEEDPLDPASPEE